MAECVVPPNIAIVKCRECGALYVPDRKNDVHNHYGGFNHFEMCPVCNSNRNNYSDTIPLWKYNLIRWFRRQ